MSFLEVDILDILDIFLVSVLIYQLYKLVKNTVAIKILMGIGAIYVLWKLVELLRMELLSEILGQFIGVGVLAIIIVFQQEIRKFLLLLGNNSFSSSKSWIKRFQGDNQGKTHENYEILVSSAFNMSKTNTGALIVIQNQTDLSLIRNNGKQINGNLSSELIECIFYKNNPLHDGAMIVDGSTVVAAACILPISDRTDLDYRMGTRHRAAYGLADSTDAKIIVVSEETGAVSYTFKGKMIKNIQPKELFKLLVDSDEELIKKDKEKSKKS